MPAAPTPSPSFARASRPAPPPLDLSVARLDQLIARVEAGMARRAAAPAPATIEQSSIAPEPVAPELAGRAAEHVNVDFTPVAAPVMAEPEVAAVDDPSFPNDPALAAALATLRRMAVA